jgi:hypothetical protein
VITVLSLHVLLQEKISCIAKIHINFQKLTQWTSNSATMQLSMSHFQYINELKSEANVLLY